MKNILEIPKGSIITRVAPAAPYGSGIQDRSYMGDKLKFVGVANNQIYFQRLDKHSIISFGADKIFDVPLDLWENGWDYYVDPTSLLTSTEDKGTLEYQLQRAVETENYEEAARIKNLLTNGNS